MSRQLDLFDAPDPRVGGSHAARGNPATDAATPRTEAQTFELPDQAARTFAVDPRHNVVLEASAGTGKTTVLVHRYLNLLRAGVDPSHILAMTFTRKAAAEMRERILHELKRAAALSPGDRALWAELRDRLSDVDISTIDAFCLSLLREFPLEADLEPGFSMADETEVPRLIDEALDRALRIALARARDDEDLALVLAQLGIGKARVGLAHLLQRRLVARQALERFLAKGPADLRVADVCRRSVQRLQDALRSIPVGFDAFIADGPLEHARFRVLAHDLAAIDTLGDAPPPVVRGVMERVRRHFLTKEGSPRTGAGGLPPYKAEMCASAAAWKRHREAIALAAPQVKDALDAFARDLNVILARGVRRMFSIALNEYRRTLDARSVLDFSDVLERAIALLGQMDEFAQSRYRLEARYQHVLVDEFQDTSRAQWQLVSLLIEAWGQGSGIASDALPPSIFVVGDRKQSIYRFRDAEVTVLDEAAQYISMLRPDRTSPRQAIRFSFRGRPELLSFVNDVFSAIEKEQRPDAFRFEEPDRFPLGEAGMSRATPGRDESPIGLVASDTPEASAAAVAQEIARVLTRGAVRDRETGAPRKARPGDIAILFRSRASHREFEEALEARGVPTYVYKGLGFFDADEIKDVVALLRYLADPSSDLRAAALLRSRFVRVSDEALCRLAPRLAGALTDAVLPSNADLSATDRARLDLARRSLPAWLRMADEIPPAELLDRILADAAYDYELHGPRRAQARENLKKMRALIRRIQNRGYATLRRIAEHLDSLSAGDESNATLEAIDAVNLMTVHAAKGLEYPIVFVVNLAKGAGGPQPPVRVVADTADHEPSVSVASYISETDEDQRDRETEETKRLLYVAMTRARDSLYLATVLKDGEMRPGRGSLGDVLPDSVRALFSVSMTKRGDRIDWTGISGALHRIRVIAPAEPAAVAAGLPPTAPAFIDAFGPLRTGSDASRIAATDYARQLPGDSPSTALAATTPGTLNSVCLESSYVPAREAIVGRLVHRLFQASVSPDDVVLLIDRAAALLGHEERAQLEDVRSALTQSAELYRSLAGREDVLQALGSGSCEYEVPFALAVSGAVVRGTIDCVVQRPDGSVFVMEFKTGGPQPEHQQQLELYLAAVRTMFPAAQVDGRIFYP